MSKDAFHISSAIAVLIILSLILFSWKRAINQTGNQAKEGYKELFQPIITLSSAVDEKVGNYAFKQIQLVSHTFEQPIFCFATVTNVTQVFPNGDKTNIILCANELIWATSNSGINQNRLSLTIGIPAKLYIARINTKEKFAELANINGFYTPIENGTYTIQIRLDGVNFTPLGFTISFQYDGMNTISFTGISKLSKIEFLTTEFQINKPKLSVKPNIIQK